MRSYVLSLYLSHLQKSVGEYNGEKHYTSMLTPTERRVHQKEKKLYENRDPFRPGEDITSFESSGSPPKKGFGYLDRPPFPIYIYAPVFVSHFRTLQTDVGEQKTPFALQMLCTVALHSLLQLGGHSSPVPGYFLSFCSFPWAKDFFSHLGKDLSVRFSIFAFFVFIFFLFLQKTSWKA